MQALRLVFSEPTEASGRILVNYLETYWVNDQEWQDPLQMSGTLYTIYLSSYTRAIIYDHFLR